jgi:hypothetical protein
MRSWHGQGPQRQRRACCVLRLAAVSAALCIASRKRSSSRSALACERLTRPQNATKQRLKSAGEWQMKSTREGGSSMASKETAKKPYQEPKVIGYGTVADLTKKPGSRADGHKRRQR